MLTFRNIGLINLLFFTVIIIFGVHPWYFHMLTVAQIIFLPLVLHMVTKDDENLLAKFLPYFAMPAFISVMILQLTTKLTTWEPILAAIYLVFTVFVALYGLRRFLARGFTHVEELFIDIGLIYLAIGGAWFVAHIAEINTGFSPMITWLTGIHFHYSAFLLPIFIGFLGRIYQTVIYKWAGVILVISPMIVAIGITFSTVLELVSVIIYIVGIYIFIFLSFRAPFKNSLQKWFIRLSFGALGISIVFSLLYAYGNVAGTFTVSIEFMLLFHGVVNTCLFALVGILGWMLHPPQSTYKQPIFPTSNIRGKSKVGDHVIAGKTDEQAYNGLVDDFTIYEPQIQTSKLAPAIVDFYENTNDYQLFARVQWKAWFKPLAALYKIVSRYVEQLNLPFSSRKIEMTGDIISIQDTIDGREHVRAWVRGEKETIFVALYSIHETKGRAYMNIALPLPYSSMHGILALTQSGRTLRLTSRRTGDEVDAGIYLSTKKHICKLPIEEQFDVLAHSETELSAQHNMWIFGIPFLTIDYEIKKRESDELGKEYN